MTRKKNKCLSKHVHRDADCKTEMRATNSGETNNRRKQNHTENDSNSKTPNEKKNPRMILLKVQEMILLKEQYLEWVENVKEKFLFLSFDAVAVAAAAAAAATLLTVCFCATCWPHVNFTEQNTHQSWICQTIRLSFPTVC